MTGLQRRTLFACFGLALATACSDDGGGGDETTETSGASGDGDGDASGDGDGDPSGDGDGDPTTGDGDGDPTTGDGDGDEPTTGDGDGDEPTTGDGDGDEPTTGDGDGDPTTGDGDGDEPTTGDGDGDPNECGPGVSVCQGPAGAPWELSSMAIEGDCLTLEVSYSGGCEDHSYSPCWGEFFLESEPVQTDLYLHHDDNDDACDGIVGDTWTVDLGVLKQAWQDAYQAQNGTIILRVAGQSINYDF